MSDKLRYCQCDDYSSVKLFSDYFFVQILLYMYEPCSVKKGLNISTKSLDPCRLEQSAQADMAPIFMHVKGNNSAGHYTICIYTPFARIWLTCLQAFIFNF